jgi:hypothetical protein
VERVLLAAAVGARVGERADHVQHLDDRARPAVRDHERQRVIVLRAHVDEVDIETVDLGHELRQAAQPRIQPPEVVLGPPVARECLDRRKLHTLRKVVDGLLLGPARRRNASAEVVQLLLPYLEVEGPDLGCAFDGAAHHDLRCLGLRWD